MIYVVELVDDNLNRVGIYIKERSESTIFPAQAKVFESEELAEYYADLVPNIGCGHWQAGSIKDCLATPGN